MTDPFTLADDLGWTGYRVVDDVRFLSAAAAAVMGRIDSADVFQDGNALWPSGYILRLSPNGAWELLSAEFNKPTVTLAYGFVAIDHNQWYRLELRFRGKGIEASLHGAPLTSVENSVHTHGMFAMGTAWDRVQFDKLRATPYRAGWQFRTGFS